MLEKSEIWYWLLATIILGIKPVGAESTNILLFIDSDKAVQLEMVATINHDLNLSPTLKRSLALRVIDVSGGLTPRFANADIQTDSDGKWVSQYKPRTLPWLICRPQQKTVPGRYIGNANEIRQCLEGARR